MSAKSSESVNPGHLHRSHYHCKGEIRMLVKNWMSHPPVTVNADAALQDAVDLLAKHGIHMLPVVDNDHLTGVITNLDIKRASTSEVFSLEDPKLANSIARIKVKAIMNKKPVTIADDHTIEETAVLLFAHNISGVPVVNSARKLVGVITKNDIFRALISLTGINKKGIQFAVRMEDRRGSIKEIADIIREHGGRIASILSTRKRPEEGFLHVYIRAYGLDLPGRQKLRDVIAERFSLIYIVDHDEDTRKIY
jgi:acetoin utilization protein AcuB